MNIFDGSKEDEMFYGLNKRVLLQVSLKEVDGSIKDIPVSIFSNLVLGHFELKRIKYEIQNKVNYHPKILDEHDNFEYKIYHILKKRDSIIDVKLIELPYYD